MCDHVFEYVPNWETKFEKFIDGISIPMKCAKCGLEANENWVWSDVRDAKTNEVIQ